jgi:CHASE2 domain-containing sensor protein
VMLNYRRTTQGIAQTVTLQQALSGQVPPATIKDRIILIGSINPSSNDFWANPFGAGFAQKQPGVFIHAQMVSQILSAVQDNRPLLDPIPFPQLMIISIGSAAIGGSIASLRQRYLQWLFLGGSIVIIHGTAWGCLTRGLWLPVGMPILSLTASAVLQHQDKHRQV